MTCAQLVELVTEYFEGSLPRSDPSRSNSTPRSAPAARSISTRCVTRSVWQAAYVRTYASSHAWVVAECVCVVARRGCVRRRL